LKNKDMKIIQQKDNQIIVDITKIKYNVSLKNQETIDKFFNGLSSCSNNTGMITTWLGGSSKEGFEGGKVVMGWNQLSILVWALLNDTKVVKRSLWQRIKELFRG